MKISEVAKRAGISIDTVRYYEKMGLIDQTHYVRRANNYRDYAESVLTRLELIKQGQTAGFTLAEIAMAATAWEANAIPASSKIEFFTQKLTEIDAQIERLNRIRAYIQGKIEMFREEQAACTPAAEAAAATPETIGG